MKCSISASYVSQKGETVMAVYSGDDASAVEAFAAESARALSSVKGVTAVKLTRGDERAVRWMRDGGKVWWGKVVGGKLLPLIDHRMREAAVEAGVMASFFGGRPT